VHYNLFFLGIFTRISSEIGREIGKKLFYKKEWKRIKTITYLDGICEMHRLGICEDLNLGKS